MMMNELAHHVNASSLDYKEWQMNDVMQWLDEHLKLPQYRDIFCKYHSLHLGKHWSNQLTCIIAQLGIDGSLLDHITDSDL